MVLGARTIERLIPVGGLSATSFRSQAASRYEEPSQVSFQRTEGSRLDHRRRAGREPSRTETSQRAGTDRRASRRKGSFSFGVVCVYSRQVQLWHRATTKESCYLFLIGLFISCFTECSGHDVSCVRPVFDLHRGVACTVHIVTHPHTHTHILLAHYSPLLARPPLDRTRRTHATLSALRCSCGTSSDAQGSWRRI